MILFLDTEFNGMGGDLISMALVPERHSPCAPFYEVVEHGVPAPWVAEHVIPLLDKEPIPMALFKYRLKNYLEAVTDGRLMIIADWPDDFKYLCESFVTGPGVAFVPNLAMQFTMVDCHPERPHNALSDAIALRDAYCGTQVKQYG